MFYPLPCKYLKWFHGFQNHSLLFDCCVKNEQVGTHSTALGCPSAQQSSSSANCSNGALWKSPAFCKHVFTGLTCRPDETRRSFLTQSQVSACSWRIPSEEIRFPSSPAARLSTQSHRHMLTVVQELSARQPAKQPGTVWNTSAFRWVLWLRAHRLQVNWIVACHFSRVLPGRREEFSLFSLPLSSLGIS